MCQTLNLFLNIIFLREGPPANLDHAAPFVRQLIWFNFESEKDDKHILNVTEISVRQL